MNTTLEETLEKLGLYDKQIMVYMALREHEHVMKPASSIAKKTGLKRPTTYMILEGLVKKGYIHVSKKDELKYFFAPRMLLIQAKKVEINNTQKALRRFISLTK